MAYLLTKTRGGASIQGKQKVYFACHPDDFERYFEEISEDILKTQNCAIYYKDNAQTYANEELLADISEMQLIVVPVTTKLLVKPNNAMDTEVPFAFEKKIPVLPLMQEDGLDELYERKFGELQYLAKFRRDDTAISFDEKLKKYLESVLIGDELAKKVRAAFRAYIFLSYRKKDRKYAQELMRLIHKNDFCRDIAIWYDEFLTPGENFNDAIAEAMAKSSLFALAVTPNVIEDNNYVMTVEYPEAAKSSKKILPAEMVPTDRAILEEKYKNIPPCVSATDDVKLSAALIEQLRDVAEMPIENDVEHNFFIGLAYLGGIDVESDYERAANLITQAAEAGLPEAMEKLALMYENGEGVERDYKRSLQWRAERVKLYIKRWSNTPNVFDGMDAVDKLIELGDDHRILTRDLTKAKTIYESALKIFNKAWGGPFMPRSAREILFVIYDRLNYVALHQGDLSAAKEYADKYAEIAEVLAEDGTTKALSGLSIEHERKGDLARAEGDFLTAKENYEKALEIELKIADKIKEPEIFWALAICNEKLAIVEYCLNDLSAAREYNKKALELSEQCAKETESKDAIKEMCSALDRLGEIESEDGNVSLAKEYYNRENELIEKLEAITPTADVQRLRLLCNSHIGSLYKIEGDFNTAKSYFEKSLDIAIKLAETSGTPLSLDDLAKVYRMISDVCEEKDRLPFYREEYSIRLKLTEMCPQNEEYRSRCTKLKEDIEYLEFMKELLTSGNWVVASFD